MVFKRATGDPVWLPVPRWDGVYEVSQYGVVRRVKPNPHTTVGRERKASPDRDGYLQITLRDGRRMETIRVHQAVCGAFIGPCPEGKEVNHEDTDKTNNHVSNLEYVTPGENSRHAAALGRRAGTMNANSKLTEEQVVEIRNLYATGAHTQADLGRRFGVSQVQISNIIRRRHGGWSHHTE